MSQQEIREWELFLEPLAALWSVGRHEEVLRLVAQKMDVPKSWVGEALSEMIRDGEV
jgi:hypothetical protein